MKILSAIFWLMFGGTLASMAVNYGVIAANAGDLSTPEGMAIYNLHDHLLGYALFFIAGTVISLVAMIAVKLTQNSKK